MKLLSNKKPEELNLVSANLTFLEGVVFVVMYIVYSVERAKRSSSMRLQDSESATPDANERFIRIEQLLCKDLSQSQMDLIIHGENAETGIQGQTC